MLEVFMSSTTNLYRAITRGDFPDAKEQFFTVMREKLSAAIGKEYKSVAAEFNGVPAKQK
jgi:hypothetical protein